MVRELAWQKLDDGVWYREFSGLSTDTKPTENLATGSIFIEVDTKNVYFFEEENAEWLLVSSAGGGNDGE